MPISDNITYHPEAKSFVHDFKPGKAKLVWAERSADMDTPVSAMLRLGDTGQPSFLLESVEKGEIRGRYSVIGLMPDCVWRCFGTRAEIAYENFRDDASYTPCESDSMNAFRELYQSSILDIPEGLPPMASGLIGYMSYDMVKLMEKLPDTRPDSINVPDACFMRPSVMVIFDNVADKMYVIATVREGKGGASTQALYDHAIAQIDMIVGKLRGPLPTGSDVPSKAVVMDDFQSNTDRDHYDKMLESAREYICAGDIFQVVLSQRFSAPFTLPSFALYRALRYLNPSPFLFHLDFCDYQLIGSSPEILVRLRDKEVTVRPIAGTRKRGKNKTEDTALAKDLLSDPKELAEHLMLLDLGRNDVGRVAKINSVATTQSMNIENYSHVMHIVSNVVGTLNDNEHDALSALAAGFPAGTVSGAPKIRAMEIIDELETERRSFYAGCVGYFSASGDMDTCITLRTGLVKDGVLHVQAGGGIVADSKAEDEYQESINKAQALMHAAVEAVKFV